MKNTTRNHSNDAHIFNLKYYGRNSLVFLKIYLLLNEQTQRLTNNCIKSRSSTSSGETTGDNADNL